MPASVFISAGQSNADGRAYISEGLPAYMAGGYSHLQFANVTSESRTSFYPRVFDGTQENRRFAFSDVANYWIEQALGEDFYSIKCAYGGTAIALGQTAAKLPFWNASEEYLDTARAFTGNVGYGTSLAKSLTEGFRSLAQHVLSQLPQGYDVKAIMWHQGESDRKAYSTYRQNLADLINYLRGEIYAVTGDEADLSLPFIMGTVSRSSAQYSDKIEEAQRQVAAALENVYIIELGDAALRSDNLHFNAAWTEYFGKQVYNKLVGINAVDGTAVEAVKPDDGTVSQLDTITVEAEREWNLAKERWSQQSLDSLAQNTNYTSGYGYRNSTTLKEEQLSWNGYTFPETEGLFFTVTKTNRVGLHPNRGAVCLIGGEATLIVPQVKPGQFIYVRSCTATSAKRGVVATATALADLDVLRGDTASTSEVESVYWVQDSYSGPVDAAFTVTGGTSYVYVIRVSDANPLSQDATGIEAVEAATAEGNSRDGACPALNNNGDTIYALDGRRVSSTSPRPGIYVRGGRKVVID